MVKSCAHDYESVLDLLLSFSGLEQPYSPHHQKRTTLPPLFQDSHKTSTNPSGGGHALLCAKRLHHPTVSLHPHSSPSRGRRTEGSEAQTGKVTAQDYTTRHRTQNYPFVVISSSGQWKAREGAFLKFRVRPLGSDRQILAP